MRLDLYQAETARIAAEQSALLAQAKASDQPVPVSGYDAFKALAPYHAQQ